MQLFIGDQLKDLIVFMTVHVSLVLYLEMLCLYKIGVATNVSLKTYNDTFAVMLICALMSWKYTNLFLALYYILNYLVVHWTVLPFRDSMDSIPLG